jgi:hypothetical protein
VLSLAAALAHSLEGPGRRFYLPGPTTSGHYQIELACEACHTSAFSDRGTLQAACVRCHGAELALANDSHPESKFADPRNADRVAALDARFCVTCHREHRPELVSTMGLSLPGDYCFRCHESIGEERSTHAGLTFDTCASAGCHNFHDNRALYEDFLAKNLDSPAHLPDGRSPSRSASVARRRLLRGDSDAPKGRAQPEQVVDEWERSAHALAGVNCTGCHSNAASAWQDDVAESRCADCHAGEQRGFREGRHGMRLAVNLSPLRVADARQPMKAGAGERMLECTSCHGEHTFDTRAAAVEACLGCHDDQHSRAYRGSRHDREWSSEPSGQRGASCATCHLPRTQQDGDVHVAHNQNDNLRPNEKMVRSVCLNCHGLQFALDALADAELVKRNFQGSPKRSLDTLNMVRNRHASNESNSSRSTR